MMAKPRCMLLLKMGTQPSTVTELARLGADVTIADNGGETPVYAAARKGHTATVTELELAISATCLLAAPRAAVWSAATPVEFE